MKAEHGSSTYRGRFGSKLGGRVSLELFEGPTHGSARTRLSTGSYGWYHRIWGVAVTQRLRLDRAVALVDEDPPGTHRHRIEGDISVCWPIPTPGLRLAWHWPCTVTGKIM